MAILEYLFDYSLSPLEKSRYRSVFHYIQNKSLDMSNRKSLDTASKYLNLAKKQLIEIIEEFVSDNLVSIGNGFPGIEVKLTEAGLEFVDKFCVEYKR